MTREERLERTTRLCRELSRRISEAASPGLGNWAPAWEMVESVSEQFLDLIHEWEETEDSDARRRLEHSAGAVLDAWKEADRLYRQAIGTREEVPA